MKRRAFLKTALLSLVAAYSPISLKGEKKLTIEVINEAVKRTVEKDDLVGVQRIWWRPGIWDGDYSGSIEMINVPSSVIRCPGVNVKPARSQKA